MKEHLRYNLRNPLAFCERIIEADVPGEEATQAGSREVLNYAMLVRGGQNQHIANGKELLRGATGSSREAAPETLPRPSDAPSDDEEAAPLPAIPPDAPRKPGPFDRWFRRSAS